MPKTPLYSFVAYLFCPLFINLFFSYNIAFSQKIRIIVPEEIEDHLNKKEVLNNEIFTHYPFRNKDINLTHFKRQHPSLGLPNTLQIKLPDLAGIQDTALLIGYLSNETRNTGHLIIVVVGNYESNEVTFFVDTNLDQDYRNDEASFVLEGGVGSKTVFIQPRREKPLKLTLSVPKKLNPIDQKLKELKRDQRQVKTKIRKGLSLGISAGIGAGKLTYEYDNIAIGYPTWYNVRFTEKSLNLSANYEMPKFRIGINANFINNYYYTAYFNMRVMEPMGIRTGVLEERNIDQHALNRVNLGATLAYKFNLGRLSTLSPFITYGQNFYLSDQYFADTRPNKEVAYDLSPNNFLEYGAQLEFTVGNQQVFFVGLSRTQLQWQPNNFLEGINFENLSIRHYTWKMSLGYKFGL